MTQTDTTSGTHGVLPASVPAVQLSGVTKDFGPVHAVRGIDLVPWFDVLVERVLPTSRGGRPWIVWTPLSGWRG
jgi:hypothetical protein